MLRKLLFVAIIFSSITQLLAQTTLHGSVKDTKGSGLSNINILIQNPADSTILAFGYTDDKGAYSVIFSASSLSHVLVKIAGLEVKEQSKRIENRSQRVDFKAEFEVTQIEEVVVKAQKIWQDSDTINYRVSSFLDSNDLVIADVLKKMPGISVSDDGSITYRGQAINKFYIENMDLLKGRYGIATQNLQAKDISTVQVFENHQPIKMLDGIQISTDAAINIKLKEGAKNIFTMQALVGAGYDKAPLWLGELVGTLFNRTNQNIITARSSNTGDTPDTSSSLSRNEIVDLALTGILTPSQPPIQRNRYFDLTAHSAGTNHLFKLKSGAEFTSHANFTHSHEKREGYASVTYNIPNAKATLIEENLTARMRTNTLQGGLSYTLNNENRFVSNETRISADWMDNKGQVVSSKTIDQQYRSRSIHLFNSFSWGLKTDDERGIAISFDNAYRTQPHQLTIFTGLYPDLLNGGNPMDQVKQEVSRSALRSVLEVKGISAISIGDFSVDPLISLKMDYETLASDVYKNQTEQVITQPQWRNDMTSTLLEGSLGIEARYRYRNLNINVGLPLSYRFTHLDYKVAGQEDTEMGSFKFLPTVRVAYRYRNIQWELGSSLSSSTPTISRLYRGFVLRNYRSINRYAPQIFDTHSFYSYGNLGYKSVAHMFFVNGALNYSRQWSKGVYAQRFDDQLSVIELVEHPNKSDNIALSSEVSKGFYWKDFTMTVLGYWSSSHTDLLRQTQSMQYKGYNYGVRSKLNLAPWKWLVTNYEMDWSSSRGEDSAGQRYEPIHNVDQSLHLLFKIAPRLTLTTTGEHYYNSAAQGNQHFFLADLSLVYQAKRVRFTLDCTNIFNTRSYTTYNYGAMSTFYSNYNIRPTAVLLTMRFKAI